MSESSNLRGSTTPPLLKEIQTVTPISTSNTNTKIIKVQKKTQHKANVDIGGENDQCDCNAAQLFPHRKFKCHLKNQRDKLVHKEKKLKEQMEKMMMMSR